MLLPILMIDGGEAPIYNYTIPYITVTTTSPTNVTVTIGAPPDTPVSYKVEYSTDSTFATITASLISITGIFSISGLTAGQTYYIRARGHSGASGTGAYGGYLVQPFTMPVSSSVGGINTTPNSSTTPVNADPTATAIALRKLQSGQTLTDAEKILLGLAPSTAINNGSSTGTTTTSTQAGSTISKVGTSVAISGNSQVSRSLFTVSNNAKQLSTVSLVEKDMLISTADAYYSFGTTLFFPSNVGDTRSTGGIGFFTSNGGSSGYFVELKTTSNLANKDDKEVLVYKVSNNKKVRLPDTQSGIAKSFNGLYGGQSYKVDIKVQVQVSKVIINVYVNNLMITATDTTQINTTDPAKIILPKTSKVAMFCSFGKSNFDYIYAIPLSQKQYESPNLLNIYTGQFNSSSINFLYGEKVLNNFNKTTVANGVLEEFGTIARELRRINIKYNSRPAFPIYSSIGINSFIEVVGSKLGSFGAEVYLLNNAGTYVPLDDSGMSSFTIIGNYIAESGQHEYTDTVSNEYDNPEPATFDSRWIQSEPDAKSLSEWIKKQWSKQQMIVSMKVFGNPLISVGDVVNVKYSSNDLDGTQKFIVTSVNNSYNEGLETSITCRSIYS